MKTLLASVVIIGLAAVAGAVIVGIRVFDGTVVKEPYERGIAWDEERARLASSGLRVDIIERSFHTGENLISFNVLRGDTPFEGKSITVQTGRPSSSAHDRTFTASRGLDGVFRTMVDLPLQGRWDLIVVVDGEEGPIHFRRGIYVRAKTPPERPAPCDLNAGPCVAVIAPSGTEVVLDITPKPLRTMVPLQFTVALGGESDDTAGDVIVEFTMPGMFMGDNTVRLESAGERLWRGSGVIVRCPSGRKTWQAGISIPGRGNAAFTFEVDR